MTGYVSDQEAAIARDVAAELTKRLRLTPDGKSYADRFARYLLTCNGLNEVQVPGVKRPRFNGSLTLGRYMRDQVASELSKAMRDTGRKFDLAPGTVNGK